VRQRRTFVAGLRRTRTSLRSVNYPGGRRPLDVTASVDDNGDVSWNAA